MIDHEVLRKELEPQTHAGSLYGLSPNSGLPVTKTQFLLEDEGAQVVWGSVPLLPSLSLLSCVGLVLSR